MKIFIFLFVFFSINIHGAIDLEAKNFVTFINNQLRIEYHLRDKTVTEIHPENRPYVSQKESSDAKNVTYLLHGFIGSPYEMKYIAEKAFERGDLIFNDLILGYGTNANVSNQFKGELWYKQVERNLNFIFNKYEKINLVGFSTGGLLITHYLKNHPEHKSKVGKIRFISPFYTPNFIIAPTLGKFLSFFVSEVSTTALYKYIGFPDVEVATLLPNYYLQTIPLKSALEVSYLAEKIYDNPPTFDFTDVEIFLTQEDQVLNFNRSEKLLRQIFPKAKLTIFSGKNSPHHLMAPIVSQHADTIKYSL